MGQLIIPLSFKQEEKYLYDEIKKHSGYSYWIKEAIKDKITKESNNQNANGNMGVSNFPVYDDNMFNM